MFKDGEKSNLGKLIAKTNECGEIISAAKDIPNIIIKCNSADPPWITVVIKSKLEEWFN